MNKLELLLYFISGFCVGALVIFTYWFIYVRDVRQEMEATQKKFNEIYELAIKMCDEETSAQ